MPARLLQISIAAAVLMLAGCRGAGRPPQALEQAVLAGRWADVERAAPEWAKNGGDRTQAGILAGYAALARGDLPAATRQFALAKPGARFTWAVDLAARHPGNAIAHLISADALARQGDRTSALTQLNVALSIDPNLALARLARATLLAAREPGGALADADRLAAAPALAAEALAVRGTLHLEAGDLEPALDELSRAIEVAPSHAVAYNARGVVHAKEGDWEAAAADFATAFRLLPELKVARENWQFVQSAAARASVVSSKITIYTPAVPGAAPETRPPARILVPIPGCMPATDAARTALTRQIAQVIQDRVREGKERTYQVRLVQRATDDCDALPPGQNTADELRKLAHDALAIVQSNLKRDGLRVDVPEVAGDSRPRDRGGISLASADLARAASRELAAVYTLLAAGRRR
jgi:tetratricopeptide (TPR) repeat protein